jgi:hypothetical protein
MITVLVGSIVFSSYGVGCVSMVPMNPRWTADYCSEHESDFEYAMRICVRTGCEHTCVYAEEYTSNCRRVLRND